MARPELGQYLNEHFCSAHVKVGTFTAFRFDSPTTGNKEVVRVGGNVAVYFCDAEGRVLNVIAGKTSARDLLREAKWVVETHTQAVKECQDDTDKLTTYFRRAHEQKLQSCRESSLVAITDGQRNRARTEKLMISRPLAMLDDIKKDVYERVLLERLTDEPVRIIDIR